MAATCTMQQPFGPGPRGPDPRGPNGAPGPSRPEDQHHKPFFYVQPSQPFLPLQWPVPMQVPLPLGQYYPYPGYGMPVMPSYQSYPYMEPPSFIVPHTHLHLTDYRRVLNPQYYQTLAYQSRRFRYQHNSQTRETANSEVQTEPQPEASSSPPSSPSISPSAAVQKNDDPAPPPARPPPNGSFLIQTEEVRIECCATPVGMQLLRSHEASGVSHGFSQKLSQLQDNPGVPEDQAEVGLRSCPDILLVGTPSNGESVPPREEEPEGGCSRGREKDAASETFRGSIQLPFDPKYLDELRKMESVVWSAEDTPIPSPQPFLKNDFPDSYGEKLSEEVPGTDVPKVGEPSGVPEAESLVLVAPPESAVVELKETDESCLLLLDDPPPREENQDRNGISIPDLQDSSFESLPAYLPSASWLADFGSARYRSRPLPPSTRAGSNLPPRRRKLELEGEDRAMIRMAKERYDPGAKLGRRSLSDHECCLVRKHQSALAAYAPQRERLCARCLAKRAPCASPKRNAVPFRQRNDAPLPTCDACTWRPGKCPPRGSAPHGRDTDGESSENGSGAKCRTDGGVRRPGDPKRPLASKQNLARPRWEGRGERLRCPHGNAIHEMDENCALPPPLQDKWKHVDAFYLQGQRGTSRKDTRC